MKTSYLLSTSFNKVGWILFIPGVILGIATMFTGFEPDWLNLKVFAIASNFFFSEQCYLCFVENEFTDEIAGLLIILGALFISFSKRKNEDEFISKLRLESLMWATYINYGILALAILLVYDMSFFYVMVFNMFTILIFFIIRFNWALAKANQTSSDEE
ncbi:MAG TPA: LPXTG cell wall anchor domain-containing protein [Salinimicrobium sp.]|nr:LPXTG cell wall anchor domain-containing protein [Salinimicrobium sp.]